MLSYSNYILSYYHCSKTMLNYISYLCFFLLSTTTSADYILLDCGSTTNSTSSDGRNWQPDDSTTTAAIATSQDPTVTQIPYMTARISNTSFTYTFPVTTGTKFLRLYLYPATYSNLNTSQSFFSLSSNGFSLLTNFSAFLTVSAAKPKIAALVKEFIVHVNDTQILNVTFSPIINSFAFINGIEVVSVPENLYPRGGDYSVKHVGQNSFFPIDAANTALETVYRLNVGGNSVPVTGDSGTMFRSWVQDNDYMYGNDYSFTPHRDDVTVQYTTETPNYTAPEIVYTTSRTLANTSLSSNLTWIFPVDSGFHYLIRLHFCEIQLEITMVNQRVFDIFIDNQKAEEAADVIQWSGGTGIPVFRDYVIFVQGGQINPDIWIGLLPNKDTGSQYRNALLNGLEIFKLNRSDGSLGGPNPNLELNPIAPSIPKGKSKRSTPFFAIIGGVAGGIALFSVLIFLIFWRRRRVKQYVTSEEKSLWDPNSSEPSSTKTNPSSLPSARCRQFSLVEVKSATYNFDGNFVIGNGGFGKVYKGYIDNGKIAVAIKRLNPSSNQGALEFQTEIGMLSKLRHLHLVSLIGYCNENGEMILVYDYMTHGTLREHLYNSNNPHLSWKQRLQICIGSAKGLHYLHTGAKRSIIHRDVKSTNILLDEKWVAKVSNFGLSKLGPKDMSQGHVSTVVKGSFGYVDPEYYIRQQLTHKSDVYSFGVVLFEVLCARPVLLPMLPKEQVSLAGWAKDCYRRGALAQIVDLQLRDKIAPECLKKFGEIAESCLKEQGMERPEMNEVVWSLEFALQLQESAKKVGGVSSNIHNQEPPFLTNKGDLLTTSDDDVFTASRELGSRFRSNGISSINSNDRFKSNTVFSEILKPTELN